jgi:hypothetical protein
MFAVPRETLQLQTLHYIIQLSANYYETMTMEKRSLADARQWAQKSVNQMQYDIEINITLQQKF